VCGCIYVTVQAQRAQELSHLDELVAREKPRSPVEVRKPPATKVAFGSTVSAPRTTGPPGEPVLLPSTGTGAITATTRAEKFEIRQNSVAAAKQVKTSMANLRNDIKAMEQVKNLSLCSPDYSSLYGRM
jgi:hypothetical protein